MPLWFGLIPGGCTKGSAAIWSVTLQLWLKRRNFHLAEEDAAPLPDSAGEHMCGAEGDIRCSSPSASVRPLLMWKPFFFLSMSDSPSLNPSLLVCFFRLFHCGEKEKLSLYRVWMCLVLRLEKEVAIFFFLFIFSYLFLHVWRVNGDVNSGVVHCFVVVVVVFFYLFILIIVRT